jgi:hypothetical protein
MRPFRLIDERMNAPPLLARRKYSGDASKVAARFDCAMPAARSAEVGARRR